MGLSAFCALQLLSVPSGVRFASVPRAWPPLAGRSAPPPSSAPSRHGSLSAVNASLVKPFHNVKRSTVYRGSTKLPRLGGCMPLLPAIERIRRITLKEWNVDFLQKKCRWVPCRRLSGEIRSWETARERFGLLFLNLSKRVDHYLIPELISWRKNQPLKNSRDCSRLPCSRVKRDGWRRERWGWATEENSVSNSASEQGKPFRFKTTHLLQHLLD